MKPVEFPEFKHYAIINFKPNYVSQSNDIWGTGVGSSVREVTYSEYIVMHDADAVADWIAKNGKSSNYRVIEATPVDVKTSVSIIPKGSRS